MIVRFVMVRTTVTREERRRLQELFYDNGWQRDKTTFVFDPTDPQSGDAHLENLRRCRDAGETVVAILEPEPLPAKAIHAGFTHLVMQRDAPMRVAAVQQKLEIFVLEPPPAI